MIGEAVGRPVEALVVPSVEQARLLGIFDATFAAEFAELFYQYTEPQVVDSGAIERAFGLYATPWDDALPTTLAWFRQNHPARA